MRINRLQYSVLITVALVISLASIVLAFTFAVKTPQALAESSTPFGGRMITIYCQCTENYIHFIRDLYTGRKKDLLGLTTDDVYISGGGDYDFSPFGYSMWVLGRWKNGGDVCEIKVYKFCIPLYHDGEPDYAGSSY